MIRCTPRIASETMIINVEPELLLLAFPDLWLPVSFSDLVECIQLGPGLLNESLELLLFEDIGIYLVFVAEAFVGALECTGQAEVFDARSQQLTSRLYHQVVVVVQQQRECSFFFQVPE